MGRRYFKQVPAGISAFYVVEGRDGNYRTTTPPADERIKRHGPMSARAAKDLMETFSMSRTAFDPMLGLGATNTRYI